MAYLLYIPFSAYSQYSLAADPQSWGLSLNSPDTDDFLHNPVECPGTSTFEEVLMHLANTGPQERHEE